MKCWTIVVLIAPLLAQHVEESKDKKQHPAFKDPQAIAAGAKLFTNSCAGCHGPRGEGGRGPNLRNRGVWHSLDENDLFQTIQKGVPGADMPGTNLPEEQIWQLAAFVRALAAPAIEANVTGDIAAGESVFWGKAGCGNCHRILGKGGLLGPDLSNIGAERPMDHIRQAILDPDADGFNGYRGVTVVTRAGQTVQGVARNHTNYSMQVLDAKGNLHLFQTSDLKSVVWRPNSPMPADYKQRLTRQEIDNLIAYLSRRSARPHVPGEKK